MTVFVTLGLSVGVSAQVVGPINAQPVEMRPTEHGVRLTPDMARVYARLYVDHGLVPHYDLEWDEARKAEVAETVTRRVMQTAHALDGEAQRFLERFLEEQFAYQADKGRGFMPPGFGREFAERVRPMIPEVRNLVRGVAQDIRPELPLKAQLKMAGEIMAFNTALDGFADTMDQWASGEGIPFGNPFEASEQIELDESGQSKRLERARQQADLAIGLVETKQAEWQEYIEAARVFYGLDESQMSTAESALREALDRLEMRMTGSSWQDRLYNNRLWAHMVRRMGLGPHHPVLVLLNDEEAELIDPAQAVEREFKQTIDDIPTQDQRQAADDRLQSMLAEKGIDAEAYTE
jgi:hypothetical protein